MKVSKWVDISQEIKVEIGADDIRDALSEAFKRVTVPGFEKVPTRRDVTSAIDAMAKFLKGMTDEHIAMLNDNQREIVRKFLLESAARF